MLVNGLRVIPYCTSYIKNCKLYLLNTRKIANIRIEYFVRFDPYPTPILLKIQPNSFVFKDFFIFNFSNYATRNNLVTTLLALFFVLSANGQYVFTGNGDWSDVNNWQGGLLPPRSLPGAATISIVGTALTTITSPIDFENNWGTVTIEVGGSLNIRNFTQFSNQGTFIVKGTYINNTVWENYPGANVYVFGVLKNQRGVYASGFTSKGTVTIENGGVFRNEQGQFRNNALDVNTPAGMLVINAGGSFLNVGAVANLFGNVVNNGTFTNSSYINGAPAFSGNLSNEATIAPGSSPGIYSITGDYSASATAVHTFEVAGTNTTQYDQINATGSVNLGGTLNVSLISGFTPATAHSIQIFQGTINGTFSTVNLPAGYTLIYNPSNVSLQFGTLPVFFISLDARKEGSGIKISWKVAEEFNVHHYEVERSSDGRQFSKIGTVSASGLSQYSFSTLNPSGKIFYRIKSLDIDGKYKYSTIINYSNGKAIVSMKAFPVPVQSEIILQHPTAAKQNQVIIYSVDGRIVQVAKAQEGNQQTTLSVSQLRSGNYIISFRNGTTEESISFIKQ